MLNKCLKCGENFALDQIDLDFYKKIRPKIANKFIEIPLPKFCPNCRLIRRQIFRNDRVFYNRKCDFSGKQFIALYDSDSPYKIYHPDQWYGDKWDPTSYGREFDFEKSFFEQFQQLMLAVPRLGIDIVNCENSYYCNYCGDDKNCYLDIAGEANEDCYYDLFTKYSKNVVDCTFVYNSELCYECINCYGCYNLQHSIYCDNCSDLYFCFDLIGCRNCLFSANLRNKEYYIFNKPYSKEEYEKYLRTIGLGSFKQREKLKAGWEKFKLENAFFRYANLTNCENCSGDNLKNCKNTFFSFNASGCEDSKYLYDVLDAKNCQDLNYSLYKPELSYELISTLAMNKSAFCMASHYNSEVYYCDMVNNSSNLFGCIGLNHKQYCILNKQYSKEEYEDLVSRIIGYMKKTGEWGNFFPLDLSPFAYNETVSNEYFPLTKDQALVKDFRWIDGNNEKIYKGPDLEISDDIKDASDIFSKEVLICEESKKPYKVIIEELKFYRRMGIPIPRKSPDQRHKDRMKLRNPRKLFKKKCFNCKTIVETTYTGDEVKKLCCEDCYKKLIY